jgi:hypothetical protein
MADCCSNTIVGTLKIYITQIDCSLRDIGIAARQSRWHEKEGKNILTVTCRYIDADPRRISAPPSQDFHRQLRTMVHKPPHPPAKTFAQTLQNDHMDITRARPSPGWKDVSVEYSPFNKFSLFVLFYVPLQPSAMNKSLLTCEDRRLIATLSCD